MQESESDMVFPEIDLGKYKHLPEYTGVLSEVQEEKRHYVYKLEVQEKANGRLLSADFKLFCLLLTSRFSQGPGTAVCCRSRSNYFFREG